MSGYGALADYDADRKEYGFRYVQLTYPDRVSGNEKRIRRRDLLRLSNVSEGSGVGFAMPEAEARSLRDAMQGADATFRARLAAQTPATGAGAASLPLTAELVELVVLHPGSDPRILDEEKVVARIVLEPLPKVQPDSHAGAASHDGPGGGAASEAYDIMDIRVGESLEVVLPRIEADFVPKRIVYGRREIWQDEDNLARRFDETTLLAESAILIRNDGRDTLTIFHEPLLPDDPITGIARTIKFAEGQRPAPEAIRKLLVEKYGDVVGEDAHAYYWLSPMPAPRLNDEGEKSVGELIESSTEQQNRKTQRFVCGKQVQGLSMVVDNEIQSSLSYGYPAFDRSYPLVDESGSPASYPLANPLWPLRLGHVANPDCDDHIAIAGVQPDESGLVSGLLIMITNRAYLAETEELAKAALIEQNTAEQKPPKIDL